MLYFHYLQLKISLLVSSLTYELFRTVLFCFQIYENILASSPLLISQIPLLAENILCMIIILLCLLRLAYGRNMDYLDKFHILLKRMYILLSLSEVFYHCNYLVGRVVQVFCILTDFLYSSLSIIEIRMLKSPNIIMNVSVSPFYSASFCFTYFEALILGT